MGLMENINIKTEINTETNTKNKTVKEFILKYRGKTLTDTEIVLYKEFCEVMKLEVFNYINNRDNKKEDKGLKIEIVGKEGSKFKVYIPEEECLITIGLIISGKEVIHYTVSGVKVEIKGDNYETIISDGDGTIQSIKLEY